MCAKLFTDHTIFSKIAQRKMPVNVELHQVSPHRRHGTDLGSRNENISTSCTKYLRTGRRKLLTSTWNLEFLQPKIPVIIHSQQSEAVGRGLFVSVLYRHVQTAVRQISLTQLAMHSTALVVPIELSALGKGIEYKYFLFFLSPSKQM